MPPTALAINGFGRIGRLVLRALVESERTDLQVVAINATRDPETLAHLLRYDSVHGRFAAEVVAQKNALVVNGTEIALSSLRTPEDLNWQATGTEIVLECSGAFRTRKALSVHLQRGAKRVLLSAPAKTPEQVDRTIVWGVNHDTLTAQDQLVSAASCTTNCLAPMAAVLDDTFGLRRGFMTTVHAYTADQRLVDGSHDDLARGRAAATAMIPTTSGAASSIGAILPNLAGKLDGVALRVPVACVSLTDLVAELNRTATVEEVNQAFHQAAAGRLKGILALAPAPLVSVDFIHDPHSAILDPQATRVVEGSLVRLAAWYDNEWGFACRMLDLAAGLGRL